MTLTLLIWAIRLRRWALDQQLAKHVRTCKDRRCKCVDLEHCDEDSFCPIGKRLFNWSFDLTFELQVQQEQA